MFPETLCCRLFGSYLNILDGKAYLSTYGLKSECNFFAFTLSCIKSLCTLAE